MMFAIIRDVLAAWDGQKSGHRFIMVSVYYSFCRIASMNFRCGADPKVTALDGRRSLY
jgi:hypothetical protein